MQHRDISAALRWVDADSAFEEHEALAKLLKGRTGYALGVSSNVGSFEYSWVSLLDSVVDAPPLIEMLPAEARNFLEEFEPRMLLPPEVAAVIRNSEENLVATTIRDCCVVRGRMLDLSVKR